MSTDKNPEASDTPSATNPTLQTLATDVLGKYSLIWLWTVIFGTTTAFGYAAFDSYNGRSWGIFSPLLAIFQTLGLAAYIASLGLQIQFLIELFRYLRLTSGSGLPEPDLLSTPTMPNTRLVVKALRLFVLVLLIRGLSEIVSLTFVGLGRD